MAVCSSLIGIVLFAPSALAMIVRPEGASAAEASRAHPSVFHAVVAGGMAGWQITLIAVGSALLSATAVIFIDHARAAHRSPRLSAA
jgi:hypothetical protein